MKTIIKSGIAAKIRLLKIENYELTIKNDDLQQKLKSLIKKVDQLQDIWSESPYQSTVAEMDTMLELLHYTDTIKKELKK